MTEDENFEPIPYCDTCGEPLDDEHDIETGFCPDCYKYEA